MDISRSYLWEFYIAFSEVLLRLGGWWDLLQFLNQRNVVLCTLPKLRFDEKYALFSRLKQNVHWIHWKFVSIGLRVVCMVDLNGKEGENWSFRPMFRMVLLLYRENDPIIGLVGLIVTMKRSLNRLSQISIWSSTATLGFLDVNLQRIIENPSFN